MRKLITAFLLISVMVLSLPVSSALERPQYYKGEKSILLKEGSRLYFDDLKLKVRAVDHISKFAVFDVEVHGFHVERLILGVNEEYNFQDKLRIKVVDLYRKQVREHDHDHFVMIEIEQHNKASLDADFSKSFGKRPYAIVGNQGLEQSTFLVEAKSLRSTHTIVPETKYLTIMPFESKKVNFIVTPKQRGQDQFQLRLFYKGKLIDEKIVDYP